MAYNNITECGIAQMSTYNLEKLMSINFSINTNILDGNNVSLTGMKHFSKINSPFLK